MGFRKFKADYIFTGNEILHGDLVLITDETGMVIEIVDKKDAGEDIAVFKGILTPGFINAHCHLELSHLKGLIPDGTGLVEFVQQVMTKRGLNEEMKLEAMRKAEQDLYDSGTVAVGDICNTIDSLIIKQNSKIHWHNFVEVSGFVDAMAEKRLAEGKDVFTKFKDANDQSLRNNSLSPHAPYSISKTLFQLLNEETPGQLITIHNQEAAAEDELYKNKKGDLLTLFQNFGIDITGFQSTGKTSLQSWLPYFFNDQNILLVHNTFTGQDDIDFILSGINSQRTKAHFCICINANKYIEQKIPPIDLLRKNSCPIIMGTDSYASNWQLNMLEEIKTIQQETASTIPLEEILQWATLNGAQALQVEDRLGSFEKGKTPGIVLINEMDHLNITIHSSAKRIG